MPVIVKENNVFILETKNTHYVLGVDKNGYNRHIHWGEKCDTNDYTIDYCGDENSNHTVLDEMRQEFTVFGSTMYRECALKAEFPDGCREIVLKYDGCESGENYLSLKFSDRAYPLALTLNYQLYDGYDIIARWITLKNTGKQSIRFEKIASAEFSFPGVKPYVFANTNGAWGAEFTETQTLLSGGSAVFESRRGGSSHNNTPQFIAYGNADEKSGEVFFASLAYSGNFKITASRDLYSVTRAVIGLNDFDFEYTLAGGEIFESPKAYCGRADGFGNMSRQMNDFAVAHILPKQFAEKPLPVLFNAWEAVGFHVNCENQKALAKLAADMGVELFVMDDGWFGQRSSDWAALGDWYVNQEKFPNGLGELIDAVHNLGMDFGIWVEPEMVNADSDLFRAHPDWAYHYDTRQASELRHQLVLNMTLPEVQDYVFTVIDDLLTNNNIKYIKWDFNRPFSETGAQNLENPKMLWYLHIKAVYDIVDRLKEKHPDVAFESCASGGGRADLGALSHFDQVWTSDNTDAVDRMVIQKGYSLLRPIKAMRTWVTDIGWISKPAPLSFRFNIAMQGVLGIGGNLTEYSESDLKICKESIALYKKIRPIVQFGDLYRLLDIEDDEVLMNHYVSKDKAKSVVFIASDGTRLFKKRIPLRFEGLDQDKRYKFEFDGQTYEKSGAYLAEVGISAHIRGAYYNKIIVIEEINEHNYE